MSIDIRNKKVTVVGLGETAMALVRLLLCKGARPFVTDCNDSDKMLPFISGLETLNVEYEIGSHTDAAINNADLIIPSPGVSPNIPLIANATRDGIPVMGEMEFAHYFCNSKILAVTGTNGKTTTTELLKTLIEKCGHSVMLAGNNDFPFSLAVIVDPAPEYIALEVSSYQLETVRHFKPWIAAVLNVTPDHLARHKTMEEYAAIKNKIFSAQQDGDIAIVNADDQWVSNMEVPDLANMFLFSLNEQVEDGLWLDGDIIKSGDNSLASLSDIKIPGRHNIQNVLAALTMMHAGNFDCEKALEGLREFKGVEHRIELVAIHNDVSFYNDSKATNIDSLKVALESFEKPIVLLAGGEGKGSDYRVLRDLVKKHVKKIILFGEDALLLEQAFGDIVPTEHATDMDAVVVRGIEAAEPGDIVLLSPACASFDMFDNFEQRGTVFKECVRKFLDRN